MKNRGFTLVELLVVMAIVGVLAMLLAPALGTALEKSRESQTSSNLRQIGAALLLHAADHEQFFPLARGTIPYKAAPATNEEISWQQQIDGYIGFTGSSPETIGVRKVFTAPSGVDRGTPRGENGFFLGSHAAGATLAPDDFFAPVQLARITRPAMHILAGEVGNKGQFEADDTDKDDYNQNDPAFGQKDPARTVQILFADGHVGGFKKFDPTLMTVRYEGAKADSLGYTYTDP